MSLLSAVIEIQERSQLVDPNRMQPQPRPFESTSQTFATEDVALEANLTTAQMRAAGKVARLTIAPLRNSVTLISGSGGNVLVLPGDDGKVVVDSGLATSKTQMSEAFRSISSDPLRSLINTHWHFDHTDGNEWMHAEGAAICAHEKTLTRMQHLQSIPEFEGIYPPSPPGACRQLPSNRQ
jgi:glyoxylase-like metal-dependent hydrolase (beta-lactamase superfamily II)